MDLSTASLDVYFMEREDIVKKTVLYVRVSVRGVLHAGQLGLHEGVVMVYKNHQLFEITVVCAADSICQFAFAMSTQCQTLKYEEHHCLCYELHKKLVLCNELLLPNTQPYTTIVLGYLPILLLRHAVL